MPPSREPLPIDPILPEVVETLRGQNCLVLHAPTGAGKTTRVPPALLDGLNPDGRIVLLEPRRLAARAAARRMAAERGGRVGEEVGYHVRFDRQAGPHTRILVVTPGILLRQLHDDPFLESASVVLFDEFHERGLDSDLALGMARLVQQTVRPELRLAAMSATLDTRRVAEYLGGCPVVASEGRLYPVEVVYRPRAESTPWPVAVKAAVEHLLDATPGDLLVFLPGLGEIRQCARELETLAERSDLLILPLYGDLPPEQQDAALLPQSRRKVILATNVAETSVTVEGVTGVVDTGLARVLLQDPGLGLDRLTLSPISKASADQRAGRAGRNRPGVCIRLWSEHAHRARPDQTEPEIRRVDLAAAVLQLWCLGETEVSRFPWLEAPPAATVEHALTLLRRLDAIGPESPTELGRLLARLPVHPRLGRLLVEGERQGQLERVALAAALLSERDPFTRPQDGPRQAAKSVSRSDVLDRVLSLEAFERREASEVHRGSGRFVLQARDQLVRTVRGELRRSDLSRAPGREADPDEGVLRALLAAFSDRLARRREPGGARGVMVGGRGVELAPSSTVRQAELFVCVDIDAGRRDAFVRQASAVERSWLPAEHLRTAVEVEFDPDAEKVVARRRLLFEDLVIEQKDATLPGDDEVAPVLARAASERLDQGLPPEDSAGALYRLRVQCLREWLPELGLPAFGDEELRELLPELCRGCRSLADLRAADWASALRGRLSYAQAQAVEREAPERLEVPTGSRIALKYEPGRPPVLAVRIQELFGLAETPRVASGRVRVLLHLLAPNYRPQQVTDDLASFWANTYPQVRKELRARYPKHAWPEDPWTAPPQRGPRRRS